MNTRNVSLFLGFSTFVFSILFSCILHSQMVYVDSSGSLRPEEIDYVNKRDHRTRNALANLLGLPSVPDSVKMPRMAFVGSGGGFRATISYIAMLAAAQQTGVFDCATYAAGLSGGAWAIISLVLRGLGPLGYGPVLRQRICEPDVNYSKKNVLTKLTETFFNNGGNCRVVDAWGTLISEKLFGDLSQGRCLNFDRLKENLMSSDIYPFPVCPVIIAQTSPGQARLDYEWLEINPFNIYCNCLGGSIPTYAFGNDFTMGKSTINKPPLPIEFYIGLVGSAFCISLGDVLANNLRTLFDKTDGFLTEKTDDRLMGFIDCINKMIGEIGLYSGRLVPAQIPNYSYGMGNSKLKNLEMLELVDAGMSINLPFPILLRKDRNIDIYIVCDASAEASDRNFTELRYAEEWARLNGIKFPSLNQFKVITPDIKIFYEDDITIPYVIYFSNQVNMETTDLSYKTEEFDRLYSFMFQLMSLNSGVVADTVKKKLNIPSNFDHLRQGVPANHCCNIL